MGRILERISYFRSGRKQTIKMKKSGIWKTGKGLENDKETKDYGRAVM